MKQKARVAFPYALVELGMYLADAPSDKYERLLVVSFKKKPPSSGMSANVDTWMPTLNFFFRRLQ